MKLDSQLTVRNAAEPEGPRAFPKVFLLTLGALLLACLWAYWDTAISLVKVWSRRPAYSHGFFVPVFAVWLGWQRFRDSNFRVGQPHSFGLVLVAAGLMLRWFGTYYFYPPLMMLSLIPVMAGLLAALGGLAAWRWSWPSILMLGFMFPLPYHLETGLQGPLRKVGTSASVYVMQSAGLDAFAEGNVIVTGQARIGVEDACSGLSMLLSFLFLSSAVALVSRRPIWERLLLILSAIPIALFSNVIRITVLGVLHQFEHSELAEVVHEYAAFLMMPIALGLLWIELSLLSRLFIVEELKPVGLIWNHDNQTRRPADPSESVKPKLVPQVASDGLP